jgi:hypothetical protein
MKHFENHINDLIESFEKKYYIDGMKYLDYLNVFKTSIGFKKTLDNIAENYDNLINDNKFYHYSKNINDPHDTMNMIKNKYLSLAYESMEYHKKRYMNKHDYLLE